MSERGQITHTKCMVFPLYTPCILRSCQTSQIGYVRTWKYKHGIPMAKKHWESHAHCKTVSVFCNAFVLMVHCAIRISCCEQHHSQDMLKDGCRMYHYFEGCELWSIVMNVSVCPSVRPSICVSTCISQKQLGQTLLNFGYMLTVVMAQSSSGDCINSKRQIQISKYSFWVEHRWKSLLSMTALYWGM